MIQIWISDPRSVWIMVLYWTIRRRVVEYGLQETTGFSALSDEQIDFYVKQFIEEHGNLVG